MGWIADELEHKQSIFGVPRELFFTPTADDRFTTEVYGQPLETPLGVAAGPHSQLAQNIVVAWLCGARFIELKTVQTLDHIEVSKPCIDMQDEGFNVEWSQELLVEESYREYLHAWVLIHGLHARLGLPGTSPGMIFNLSVGYDLEGIQKPNMRWFLDKMEDAGQDVEDCVRTVARRFPEVSDTGVPRRLSDNVTLSTMHGCPPEEIGSIVSHLLGDRGLHTSVKLNPTLLGRDRVREILNQHLGYRDLELPDQVFAQDLTYPDALSLVRELESTASRRDLVFGIKLTNTLAVSNNRRVFDPTEETMYLSGRPLHAVTVNLAKKLAQDLDPAVLMSFSGGADCDNVARLLRAGMSTVTVCSDLLRPGGYLRLGQYLANIDAAVEAAGARGLKGFVLAGAPARASAASAARFHLRTYAEETLADPALHKESFDREHTKTPSLLDLFDCIDAPCTDICDVDQKVPEYMRRVQAGDLVGAAEITREDNPLPTILGRTCHHPCEPVCLRTHMDQPLAIREIKRFIAEHEPPSGEAPPLRDGAARVAVIGGGPCGLSAATFLAKAGHPVTILEARAASGGMVSGTIPDYRAASHAINHDLAHVLDLGVEIRHNQEVGKNLTLASLRAEGFAYIVVAVGARRGLQLGIPGEDSAGVLDGLDFLRAARSGNPPTLGQRIGVVGGGDVAMDCARTARRLSDGEVTVFYRRTRAQMPAQKEEVHDLLVEGTGLSELASPLKILTADGRLSAVEFARMRLGAPDDSGRRRPEEIPGEVLEAPLDTLIVAIGQRPDLCLFGDQEIALTSAGYLEVDPETFETSLPGVFAGGDIIGDGPASIVKACGDGRLIADAIHTRDGATRISGSTRNPSWPQFDTVDLLRRRSQRAPRVEIPHLVPQDRVGFTEVVHTLSKDAAMQEASRCVDCDLMCSTCDSVCPNLAILTYRARPAILRIPQFSMTGGELQEQSPVDMQIAQGPQVAVLTDACNECGNCVTFCPTSGRPWRDKPRLFLNRGDFEDEDENAFMFFIHQGDRGIQARFSGELHELILLDGVLNYTSPSVRLVLEAETLAVRDAGPGPDPASREPVVPAQLSAMITLLRSFTESMPEFPLVEADPGWLINPGLSQDSG